MDDDALSVDRVLAHEASGRGGDELALARDPAGVIFGLGAEHDEVVLLAVFFPYFAKIARVLAARTGGVQPDDQPVGDVRVIVLGHEDPVFVILGFVGPFQQASLHLLFGIFRPWRSGGVGPVGAGGLWQRRFIVAWARLAGPRLVRPRKIGLARRIAGLARRVAGLWRRFARRWHARHARRELRLHQRLFRRRVLRQRFRHGAFLGAKAHRDRLGLFLAVLVFL